MTQQDSVFLSTLNARQADHARNSKLDSLIADLRGMLEPVQLKITEEQGCLPQWPICLITGSPRSGTTLLLQWLAFLGCFSYPTNLLTRFAYAPSFGISVQKMLFDPEYAYHGDLFDLEMEHNFSSNLGKSKGVLAPNEWFHFWRRFMPNFDLKWLSEAELASVDDFGMANELGLIEKGFGKPFCTKGLMHQYNIPFFCRRLPFLFFLNLTRNPIYVMQSIFCAREEFYATHDIWWSVRPKEYNQLKELDVYHQISGQVFFTEKAIEEGLEKVPKSNHLTIQYESFCVDPKAVYGQIVEKYATLDCALPVEYKGPESFKCGNEIRLPKKDIDGLQSAYDDFASGRITFE